MKKNFFMFVLTIVMVFIGFLIAIISFFKKKRFIFRFKNSKNNSDEIVNNDEDDEDMSNSEKNEYEIVV